LPPTEVIFYQDDSGRAPVVEWLTELRRLDRKGYAKCVPRIRRLAELGHELRHPEADYLQDGIYELRARRERVNYRILYFFRGQDSVVLAHALTKEGEIPEGDFERAIRRKEAFEQAPTRHTYEREFSSG
jgi:phage-related protein